MKAIIYNQEGEKTGEVLLPKEVFDVPMNPDLVHQVVVSQTANRRQKIAKTKDRAEVKGGGKKPWRQKGTGRARHGSIRSPLWKGGGVPFGPVAQKVYQRKITKKMRRKALFMVLSAKAKEKLILILDKLSIEKAKTKIMAEILDRLFLSKGRGLVVLSKYDKDIIKATRNIADVGITEAKDLNALDLLSYKYILLPKDAIKTIKETFVESEKRKAKSEKEINENK